MTRFTTAFDKIPLEAFRELPEEVRSEAFFRINELTNAYVDAQARDVLATMGARALSADVASSLPAGLASDRVAVWEWLVKKVTRRTDPSSIVNTGELREAILTEFLALSPTLDLIDVAAQGYPDFLRGRRDGNSILFDPALPNLWEEYFNNANPLYAAGNTLAGHTVGEEISARKLASKLNIFEAGAGCGSAARALLDRVADRVGCYTLCDISPGFLRKAREGLCRHPASDSIQFSYKLVDLNRPRERWGVEPRSFDLVYAVNVLHAVRDLLETLRGLRSLLVDGGVLILGECVRPARGHPVHPEFVFQLLKEFRNVVLDPELRPEPGFLDAQSWRASLERAGFQRVRFVPDFEAAVAAYPEHTLVTMVAEG
jgi:SAM-dependent methyltransferase